MVIKFILRYRDRFFCQDNYLTVFVMPIFSEKTGPANILLYKSDFADSMSVCRCSDNSFHQ
jgi:hypothetical protein